MLTICLKKLVFVSHIFLAKFGELGHISGIFEKFAIARTRISGLPGVFTEDARNGG